MKLVIEGNVPSQKNQKKVAYNRATGKPFIMSSKTVQEWKKQAVASLALQFSGYKVTSYPIGVTIIFYFDNKRRHDCDNVAAGVMDSLTQAGVIEDDSVSYVDCLTIQYGGVDKVNPRAEIFIDD